MFTIERFSALLTAGALLFAAIRLQRSSKKGAKNASVVIAFLAGLALLATIVGDWMQADWLGNLGVAGLIVCVCVIAVDWGIDKKPDKPAMYAAFALGLMVVLGASNLPAVGDQISDGGTKVSNQLSQMGK